MDERLIMSSLYILIENKGNVVALCVCYSFVGVKYDFFLTLDEAD